MYVVLSLDWCVETFLKYPSNNLFLSVYCFRIWHGDGSKKTWDTISFTARAIWYLRLLLSSRQPAYSGVQFREHTRQVKFFELDVMYGYEVSTKFTSCLIMEDSLPKFVFSKDLDFLQIRHFEPSQFLEITYSTVDKLTYRLCAYAASVSIDSIRRIRNFFMWL